MWKESYRVGVERIDDQHIKLFQMVDDLLIAIDQKADKQRFIQVIAFLKDYVVYHFKDEEEYQVSIQYAEIEEHKKVHREFTSTVLRYEKLLIQSNFDLNILKELAGTLTAWLIYHVAEADQKIVKGKINTVLDSTATSLDCFYASSTDVLEKMAGISGEEISRITSNGWGKDGLFVQIQVFGDSKGDVIYQYSEEFARNLIKSLMFMEVQEIDELVSSTLMEITNIICGNVMTDLSLKGFQCNVEAPTILNPETMLPEYESGLTTQIHTSLGEFELWIGRGLEINK